MTKRILKSLSRYWIFGTCSFTYGYECGMQKQIFEFQKKIWMKGKKRVHCQQNTENKTICTHKPLNSTKFIVFFITMESYDKNENGKSLMDFQPCFVIWSKYEMYAQRFFLNWTQIKKYLCDTINSNILCLYIHFCANMVR